MFHSLSSFIVRIHTHLLLLFFSVSCIFLCFALPSLLLLSISYFRSLEMKCSTFVKPNEPKNFLHMLTLDCYIYIITNSKTLLTTVVIAQKYTIPFISFHHIIVRVLTVIVAKSNSARANAAFNIMQSTSIHTTPKALKLPFYKTCYMMI